jgi:hypothetical protein
MLKKINPTRILSFIAMTSFLLSAFCFLPITTQAQEIPPEIFGEYAGDTHITNTTFEIEQTIPGVSVELKNTGTDYVLKMADFYITDTLQVPIEMNNIQITPLGEGYKLSRTEAITFTIPELDVPPIPPLLPNGGTFYNVPVKVTLGNSQIVDFVLKLNIEIVATITVVIIPIPITFNMDFEGTLFSPPVITTGALPNGTIGEAYSAIFEADGIKPVTWSLHSGILPNGLVLDEQTGEISGIPTKDSVFQFAVMATNMSGNYAALFSIEIKDIAGITAPEIAQLRVYPNPTTGELQITNYELQITSVEVFDVYGRKQKAESRKQNVIDIFNLQAGIYFVKITTEKGVQIQRIIKI